ncbi:MAG: polynucleotide adenylyltransferase PcnB, partial [Dokdonella sp.]
ADGSDPAVAWTVAVDRVMHEQAAHVAIPKRFVMATEEIWSLQSRFEQRQKKRVMRLLAHPKFRAAFDFLVIRAHDEPELKEQVEWWTEAQELDSEHLSSHLAAAPIPRVDGEAPKKRKRSRRRKRRDVGEDTASDAGVENHPE